MRKGTAFVCSTLLPHEPVACGICGAPSDSVEYNFFSNTGSLAQLSTLDGSRLHRIREHNELFPDDIKSFLLQLNSNGSSTSYTSRAGITIHYSFRLTTVLIVTKYNNNHH
jgi:hypothetical protein